MLIRFGLAAAALVAVAGCGGGPPSSAARTDVGRPAGSPAPATSSPTSPAGVSKVLVIIEENHGLDQMRTGMPYLFGLARAYGYATDYHAVAHPSLPNYLAIAGGSTFGISDDGSPAVHPIRGASVFGQALADGRTARLYAESMPVDCDLSPSGSYAVKHAPWAYFVDERPACARGMVPAGTPASGPLAADVAAGRLPDVGMLIPDLDHDAHDGSLAAADAWLRGWLPVLLGGPDFRAGRLAVVVTADENDGGGDNGVLTVVLAAGVRHRVVTSPLDHYALAGFLDRLAGSPPLRQAAGAPSFAGAFGLS